MSISVTFEEGQRIATVYGPWQYDYGQTLEASGIAGLPEAVPVHYAVEGGTTTTTRLGRFADGVLAVDIPDAMFQQAAAFWGYLFWVDAESGQTVKGVKFLP